MGSGRTSRAVALATSCLPPWPCRPAAAAPRARPPTPAEDAGRPRRPDVHGRPRRPPPTPTTPPPQPRRATRRGAPRPIPGAAARRDMLIFSQHTLSDRSCGASGTRGRGPGRAARAGPGQHREPRDQRRRGRPRRRTATSPRRRRRSSSRSGTGSPAVRWRCARARKQLAKGGYVRLGAGDDAPQVHVGAYAPQIPQVDAVVNDSWVDDARMRQGNALLISTGIRTPLSVRKPIERHRRRPGLGADPRRRGPARPRPGRRADGVPGRHRRRRGRHLQLHACSAAAGSRPTRRWVAAHISTETCRSSAPSPATRRCSRSCAPRCTRSSARGLRRRDPPRPVRRLLLPALHRRHDHAVQPLLRPGPRPQRPGNQRGTVGEMDRERGGDLRALGLHLGRRLALHRPDALRDERASSKRVPAE